LCSLAPPVPHFRRQNLEEIVKALLADHYNRKLDTDFRETTSGIAHVRFDAIKLWRSRIRISRMDEESSLNEQVWFPLYDDAFASLDVTYVDVPWKRQCKSKKNKSWRTRIERS
jgi:hypothetical protein